MSISGCASLDGRDFAQIGTEIAVNLLDNIYSDRDGQERSGSTYRSQDDDYIEVWDKDDSARRRDVRERREISEMLDDIEEGKDYVLLPTGELYPVGKGSSQTD